MDLVSKFLLITQHSNGLWASNTQKVNWLGGCKGYTNIILKFCIDRVGTTRTQTVFQDDLVVFLVVGIVIAKKAKKSLVIAKLTITRSQIKYRLLHLTTL